MATRQRGDTLVEVLMSIVVLGIVIVGAITIMTRGLEAAQIALEHSQVRTQINGQSDMLRYLRDQYTTNSLSSAAAVWKSIVTGSNTQATVYDNSCQVTQAKSGTAFYLAQAGGTVQKNSFDSSQQPDTSAVAGKGLWIEATPSTGFSPAYVDFVIRACWQGSGSTGQQQTVTAVRLYDPSR